MGSPFRSVLCSTDHSRVRIDLINRDTWAAAHASQSLVKEGRTVDAKPKAARRVTLADVAKAAGYSLSTASLVFQESPLVADGTRSRVLAAAEKLGYMYNRRAAGLRKRRSNAVALLIPGLRNPFFAELVEAIEEELSPSGFTVLLGNTFEEPEREAGLIRSLLEYRVDGLLVVPTNASRQDFTLPLVKMGVPHVLLTRRVSGVVADYVGSDDRRAGEIAAQHLLDHGCTELAYFGGPPNVYVRTERYRGFADVVRGAGASINESWSRGTRTVTTAGYEAAARLLATTAAPEGIVCHGDAIAFGLMRALREADIPVGSRVRIIGFDDVEHARNWTPSLTSISVASRQMGQHAARLLLEQIGQDGGGAVRTTVFEPQLQVRESCGVEPS